MLSWRFDARARMQGEFRGHSGRPALRCGLREQRAGSRRAAGLKQIRETEMIEDDGVLDLTVDLVTTTSHKVSLRKLKAWIESSGRDPRESAAKSRLRS